MGPLLETEHGNKYLLVVTDYFTNWVEVYPMKNMLADTTADELVTNYFTRFGVPKNIHSDQGTQLESELFQNTCELFEINKSRPSSADGLVERVNHVVLDLSKPFMNSFHNDWDIHLPCILMAYRGSVHESTGYTPNRLFSP